MVKLALAYDYNRNFMYSYRKKGRGIDKETLAKFLENLGYSVELISFEDAVSSSFSADFFIYTSSEDPDLLFKSFIEDVVLTIEKSGFCVLPAFKHLRMHENKSYFEMSRGKTGIDAIDRLQSLCFGTFEDLMSSEVDLLGYPVIVKAAHGSASKGVALAKNRTELERWARFFSLSFTPAGIYRRMKDHIKRLMIDREWKTTSLYRKKFVVQEFIPDLDGDFKVIVMGRRYFVLRRRPRPGDFRASGSGIIEHPVNVEEGLLNVAYDLFEHYGEACASFDIAKAQTTYILIEAQFVRFGTYALEMTEYYFERDTGGWRRFENTQSVERHFADAFHIHISRIAFNQESTSGLQPDF